MDGLRDKDQARKGTIRVHDYDDDDENASKGFIPIDESIPERLFLQALRSRGGDWAGRGSSHPQKVDVVHWKQASKCSVEKETHTKTSVDCKKTVTKTATATYTKYRSTASPVYAACATNNIATAYKGLPLFGLAAGPISDLDANVSGYSYSYPDVTESYSCCVAAILSSPPAAFWGLSESISDTTDNACIVVNLDGCTAPRTNPSTAGISFEIETSTNGNGTTDDRVYSAGNAYCGQWFRGCVITDNGTPDARCLPSSWRTEGRFTSLQVAEFPKVAEYVYLNACYPKLFLGLDQTSSCLVCPNLSYFISFCRPWLIAGDDLYLDETGGSRM
ncbi:uncharacterized protein MYCFIDRAFT_178130 [Pseudocercospora fijiensis CIRAD86]|uniref:Uncharacterized protein n=1 Tax=Pseudocercospora fijiensis (strain CIRAD86) TaxID=383855 RepID=M3AQ23_PSEFD|nr:uncharacterized protein MYCFIDRAFT_178130 [Pseudocercospora fijiensis CIRAD86]EME79542.1 hypothetical protein MYCFIDRAFT_178130 [Pseudocercospora fijiensis CIRAD86]